MNKRRFPANDIISLIGAAPRYELGESVGPDTRLEELFDDSSTKGLQDRGRKRAFRTASSGRGPRQQIARSSADRGSWHKPGLSAELLAALRLGYATPAGDPRLRAAIAQRHGVAPDDVVVTVGGMHALFLIAFLLCDDTAEAVGSAPMFPLARNVLEAVGARVNTVKLTFDGGYQLDLAQLAAAVTPNTRLVSLASPHNPSGVAMAPAVLQAVIKLVAEQAPQAYVLIDETYREAAYGDDQVRASAVGLSEKVISVASLSKCHGAPGLRIGWAITRDRALLNQLTVAKFNTVVSCSAVDEALAIRVMDRHERIIAERRRALADGLHRTLDWVQANRALVDWVQPDAGAICCVRLKPAVFDTAAVERVYDDLAAHGVRVANGAWFGDDARVFRLGFGFLPLAELEAALATLSSCLHKAASSLSQV